MAYDRQSLYLRILGHFGTSAVSNDQWSVGLHLASPTLGTMPLAGLTTFLTTIAPAIQTFHAATTTKAGNACFLDRLTVARLGLNGKYEPDTQETTQYDYPAPVSGLLTTVMPWSTALVISLRTTRPRGYASNGRFYYPVTAGTLTNTTGRATSGEVTNYIAGAKTMFDAINTAAGTLQASTRIYVMSGVGAGIAAAVTSIRCDGRFDQQERRENQTVSTYSTATLA